MASKYNKSGAELESDKFKSAGASPSHNNLVDGIFNHKASLSPMSVNSFDALAKHIRNQADSLQAVISGHQLLSDDEWHSLSFRAPHFDEDNWATRPVLNELKGSWAVDRAYRAILGRAPDAEGLSWGEESLANGIPSLLFAGLLLTSKEGRSRPRVLEGFTIYIGLAILFRAASYFEKMFRIPLSKPIVWVSKLVTAIHRRTDFDTLVRWRLNSVQNTLSRWQSMLERQSGQIVAAQKAMEMFRQELTNTEVKSNLEQEHTSSFNPAVVQPDSLKQTSSTSLNTALDAYYLAFEDTHRASESEMRKSFQTYQPLIKSLKGVVQEVGLTALDLGCGRGEWISYLQENGFEAQGVDSSPIMVNQCQACGLNVQLQDLLMAIRQQSDSSFDLISALHVAEHLEFSVLYRLVSEAFRILKPNGALILETPNPENVSVGSHTFYHDHTHRNPLTPSALSFLLGYHGYERLDILRLNTNPDSLKLSGAGPEIERMNALFFGPQDFAVVGRRQMPRHTD